MSFAPIFNYFENFQDENAVKIMIFNSISCPISLNKKYIMAAIYCEK
jgi:hypothetical protein